MLYCDLTNFACFILFGGEIRKSHMAKKKHHNTCNFLFFAAFGSKEQVHQGKSAVEVSECIHLVSLGNTEKMLELWVHTFSGHLVIRSVNAKYCISYRIGSKIGTSKLRSNMLSKQADDRFFKYCFVKNIAGFCFFCFLFL